jgi:DNA (cytosine-5)-methyltransferase 1
VIFWGALQGCKLPKFPQPTTTFAGRCPEKYASYKTRRCAPHRGISAEEAIGDLPAYDWVNPRGVMGPPSYHEDMEQLKRAETIEQLHITPNQAYVGRNEQGYATAPTCEFQRKIRAGVGDGKLTNHVTPNWFDVPSYNAHGGIRNARTEQVCSVAMTPRANHSSLPLKLKPSNLSRPGKNASSTQYGRIDAKGYFPICLTIMDPGRIGSTVSLDKLFYNVEKLIFSFRSFTRAKSAYSLSVSMLGLKVSMIRSSGISILLRTSSLPTE